MNTFLYKNYSRKTMISSSLFLMTLLSNNPNILKNMFDVNYLRTLEKNKLVLNYENKRYKMEHYKEQVLNSNLRNKRANYYLNNYNISKRQF